MEISGFVQQNSKATTSQYLGLDQAERHTQLPVFILETCYRVV